MEPIVYRQLLPVGGLLTAAQLIGALDARQDDQRSPRPHTVANFVLSADGRATVGGRSRKLSDSGDRELFRTLRERADAVLAGTGTLAAEQYGRMLPAAERRERRLAAARAAEPLAVTVTRSGRLPLGIPLFAEPAARVVVFSPTAPEAGGVAAGLRHEPLPANAPLATALATLRREYGVHTLLCEGGSTLFGALLREGLVDELFLTLAPVLVGEDSEPAAIATAAQPPPDGPLALTLVGLAQRDGSLFLRYRLGG